MYKHIKRMLDILFACMLLFITALPMIIVAIAIKLEDGGTVIYKSKRTGKDLKEFNTYKFRSMRIDRTEMDGKLSHDEMVTNVGKFIRRTSLDELPQLFNILKGEMSFIGPRPWIVEYYKLFNDKQKRRASVLPGISGLAQVKGRNGISIFKKLEYDMEYIDNMSLWLDIKICFETIVQVFKKTNAEISEQGIQNEMRELREQVMYTKAV